MDYRGYSQEDEEAGRRFEVGMEADRSYDEQALGAPDFPPAQLDVCSAFQHSGGERRDGHGVLWPPCSRPQTDLACPLVQREEAASRLEFEQLQTGPREMVPDKGGRAFHEHGATLPVSREGTWGCSSAHSERIEYTTSKPREEDLRKRRVSQNKSV